MKNANHGTYSRSPIIIPKKGCSIKTVPVSVAIITRNEERNIEDALKSVKDFEDIVVVDSLSEDRTVEICRKYTDRVYQHNWQGFSKQKQLAVDYAAKSWVLILDADERVSPELKEEIIEKIKDDTFSAYDLPRKNFFLGKWIRHSGWWPDRIVRLFRKEMSYVEHREVHEKVVAKGLVGHLTGTLEHYTYRSISDYIRKMENYSSLAADELHKRNSGRPLLSMVFSPPFVFVKMYILKQGFRDGIHGFMLAMLYSFYTFLKYAKLWEKKRITASGSL